MTNNLTGIDWVELIDPSNNQTVFISLSTGITSEKRPLNVDIKNANDFEWWELLDSKSNRCYYFNTKAKQTTWTKPQTNSLIPFGNVQESFGEDIVRPNSFQQSKLLNYASNNPNKRNSSALTKQNRPSSPLIHSMGSDIQISNPNNNDFNEIMCSEDNLADKLENQCRISNSGLMSGGDNTNDSSGIDCTTMDSQNSGNSGSGGGNYSSGANNLSSTPSIKHRPFPRTNPRSIPRRSGGGGAESPVTHLNNNGSSSAGGAANNTAQSNNSAVSNNNSKSQGRRRMGGATSSSNIESGVSDDSCHSSTGGHNTNSSAGGNMPPPPPPPNMQQTGLINSDRRCHSRGSLSSAGTDNGTGGMVQGSSNQSFNSSSNNNNTNRNRGIVMQEPLIIDTSSNQINSQMVVVSSMNGAAYPTYDHPPSSSSGSIYYMTHQQLIQHQQQQMQQQQQQGNNRIDPTFSLRRPQSDQALSGEPGTQQYLMQQQANYRHRMNMVSPRSDILPGMQQQQQQQQQQQHQQMMYQTGARNAMQYGGWSAQEYSMAQHQHHRSMSPPPPPPTTLSGIAQHYPGPLPGWNSELFRKDQAPAKLLNWSKDNIHKPLLVSTDKILKSESCQAFKQIQAYMGDRKSKHSPSELVNSIIQKGGNYYPLRDEIFMQICKQTTNNPDELSSLRGWELLRVCLSYFTPSNMFRPYLEGYILRHLDYGNGAAGGAGSNMDCPTPLMIQQAADQALLLLSRQFHMTSAGVPNVIPPGAIPTLAFSANHQQPQYAPSGQHQIHIQQQQQQQQHHASPFVMFSSPNNSSSGNQSNNSNTSTTNQHQKSNINNSNTSNHRSIQPQQIFDGSDERAGDEVDFDGEINTQRLSGGFGASQFGCTLQEVMSNQYLRCPDRELPWVLVTLCEEILQRNGELTEGIFRVGGNSCTADASSMQAMCTLLDQFQWPSAGASSDLMNVATTTGTSPTTIPLPSSTNNSPHIAAAVLLRWLDSLVDPLVPPSSLNIGSGTPRSTQEVYAMLPSIHKAVLMYLIRFLQLLSLEENVRSNRMGSWNFAVALAPHIFQLEQPVPAPTTQQHSSSNDLTTTGPHASTQSPLSDDVMRPYVNFIYQLIVGLDTTPLKGVV